jgi:hypothetical protein
LGHCFKEAICTANYYKYRKQAFWLNIHQCKYQLRIGAVNHPALVGRVYTLQQKKGENKMSKFTELSAKEINSIIGGGFLSGVVAGIVSNILWDAFKPKETWIKSDVKSPWN